jgi:outer membrane protein OmpA-like peptidoglycan-associated protein
LVAALAGCASPSPGPTTRVLLLPQADGSASAVVLRSGGAEQKLSTPFERASAAAGEAPHTDQLPADTVQRRYAPLFATAPPASQRFVLHFQFGSTRLTLESVHTLSAILDAATQHPGGEIVVIGHTDTLGTLELNDRLSLQRANEVRDMLIARRFPAERLEASGRGKRDPAVPTRDAVAEQRNRRVEIIVR